MKKTITLLCLFFCAVQFTSAQFYKPNKAADTFSDSLAIIVQDFKKNFLTIEGKQLASQGEMDVFQSTITLPGAAHCAIYRFHSQVDTTASWQAIMYEGDNYEDAVKIYKSTYQKLTKNKMKWMGQSNIYFKGDLELPDENIRFTVTPLRLSVIDIPYQSFFGEIELASTYDGWEVHLNLHNKKSDAEKY